MLRGRLRWLQVALLAFPLAQGAVAQNATAPTLGQRLAADLTWSPAERERRFGAMDRLFPVNDVPRGNRVHALPLGPPLRLRVHGLTLQAAMRRDRLAGVLVLQHGAVRAEAYGLHSGPATRWTSFSVAKSITSTLIGAAVLRGDIHGIDDAVTAYLPELRGGAYDGVTVRQLLTMTSGVRWVEAYDAPDSDNVRLYEAPAPPGEDRVLTYMRHLPRRHTPGTVWNYSTGEADLAGVLLRRATGRSLAALLSDDIWKPFGMEHRASWIAEDGREFGGSGVNATLRDYGRFGLFALQGGAGAVPPWWFAEATRPVEAIGAAQAGGRGYGMGWWTFPEGSYAALGIFGQSILVDPRRDLVVVVLAAWPQASSAALVQTRGELWNAIRAAVDMETTR